MTQENIIGWQTNSFLNVFFNTTFIFVEDVCMRSNKSLERHTQSSVPKALFYQFLRKFIVSIFKTFKGTTYPTNTY